MPNHTPVPFDTIYLLPYYPTTLLPYYPTTLLPYYPTTPLPCPTLLPYYPTTLPLGIRPYTYSKYNPTNRP